MCGDFPVLGAETTVSLPEIQSAIPVQGNARRLAEDAFEVLEAPSGRAHEIQLGADSDGGGMPSTDVTTWRGRLDAGDAVAEVRLSRPPRPLR